jgi:transposase
VVTATAEALQIHWEYLPSYSPNLNLIERLWKLMKKIIVRNTSYPTFAEFVAAVRSFLANYKEYEKEIRSLITENFQLLYAA